MSSDPDGFIRHYQWDFGDGHSGFGEKVNHRYTWADAGSKTFTVVLKVTDNQGATAATSRDVTVSE